MPCFRVTPWSVAGISRCASCCARRCRWGRRNTESPLTRGGSSPRGAQRSNQCACNSSQCQQAVWGWDCEGACKTTPRALHRVCAGVVHDGSRTRCPCAETATRVSYAALLELPNISLTQQLVHARCVHPTSTTTYSDRPTCRAASVSPATSRRTIYPRPAGSVLSTSLLQFRNPFFNGFLSNVCFLAFGARGRLVN